MIRIVPRPGGSGAGDVKVFSFTPAENEVIVEAFDPNSDIINLVQYRKLLSLDDLSYSTNPLTFFLSDALSEDRSRSLQQGATLEQGADSRNHASYRQNLVLLDQKDTKELSARNFIFVTKSSGQDSSLPQERIIAFGSVAFGCILAFFFYHSGKDDNLSTYNRKDLVSTEDERSYDRTDGSLDNDISDEGLNSSEEMWTISQDLYSDGSQSTDSHYSLSSDHSGPLSVNSSELVLSASDLLSLLTPRSFDSPTTFLLSESSSLLPPPSTRLGSDNSFYWPDGDEDMDKYEDLADELEDLSLSSQFLEDPDWG